MRVKMNCLLMENSYVSCYFHEHPTLEVLFAEAGRICQRAPNQQINTNKKRVPFGLEYLLQHLCKADPSTGGPQTTAH